MTAERLATKELTPERGYFSGLSGLLCFLRPVRRMPFFSTSPGYIFCLKREEIGKILGVGYTSVSQERRRLADKMKKDRKLKELVNRIEVLCQQ